VPELDPHIGCAGLCGDLARGVGLVSELLDMIAAQMKVVQIAPDQESCRRWAERMCRSLHPAVPIPGSMAGPNLWLHI